MTGDKRHGFTLMEMLVALGLFSAVVVIATDLFFTFQKISRKTESLQRLTADARFITEAIARYVRENKIDYAAYRTPPNGAQDTLRLMSRTQVSITVHAENNCQEDAQPSFRCVLVTQGESGSERFSGSQVWIRSLQFYIVPQENPLDFAMEIGQYRTDAQPRVTVFLSVANSGDENAENYTKYDVQTTINSRIYAR